jgi:hypothetical protein
VVCISYVVHVYGLQIGVFVVLANNSIQTKCSYTNNSIAVWPLGYIFFILTCNNAKILSLTCGLHFLRCTCIWPTNRRFCCISKQFNTNKM